MINSPPVGIERRHALRVSFGLSVGLGLAATGLAGDEKPPIYTDELQDMLDAAAALPQPQPASEVAPQHEQVAVRSNPRFTQVGRNAVRAHVVVHPGFILSEVGDKIEQYGQLHTSSMAVSSSEGEREYARRSWENEARCRRRDRRDINGLTNLLRGKEGDYGEYYQNLGQLFTFLRNTDDPVVVYAEERGVYAGNKQYPELAIPDNALVVATRWADPEPVVTVRFRSGDQVVEEPQQEQLVYDWLKSRDVTTLHFAGELGLSRGGGVWPACLGTVVEACMGRGFEAHGIEGAVFPSQPRDLYKLDRDGEVGDNRFMAKALHKNTVPLPS